MLSTANLNALKSAGFIFIMDLRIAKAPYDMPPFDPHGNHFADGQTLKSTRTMVTGVKAWDRRVVYHYSCQQEKGDNCTLTNQVVQVANGQRPVNGPPASEPERYVSNIGPRSWMGQRSWPCTPRCGRWKSLSGWSSPMFGFGRCFTRSGTRSRST